MRKNFSLFLSVLFGLTAFGTTAAFADLPNNIEDSEVLEMTQGFEFCETIESDSDVDHAFLLVNPGDMIYLRIQPDAGLDISMHFWRPGETTPVFTRNLSSNFPSGDGMAEWEVLANTSGQPDTGYFVSFQKAAGTAAITAPVQYCLYVNEVSSVDMDRAWTILSAKEAYKSGEEFDLKVAYVNSKTTTTKHDWYLALEYLGSWTFYGAVGDTATWTGSLVNIPGQDMPEEGGYFLRDPLKFTVPPVLAGLSGFSFYAVSQDLNDGKFSNIPNAPVRFEN